MNFWNPTLAALLNKKWNSDMFTVKTPHKGQVIFLHKIYWSFF